TAAGAVCADGRLAAAGARPDSTRDGRTEAENNKGQADAAEHAPARRSGRFGVSAGTPDARLLSDWTARPGKRRPVRFASPLPGCHGASFLARLSQGRSLARVRVSIPPAGG